MSIELKIKAKHLALEPAIIRKEEYKLLNQIKHLKKYHQVNDNYSDIVYPVHSKWSSLQYHRKWDVRNEARATHLARAYIKGIPYKDVELKCKDPITFKYRILPRVLDMIAKYGDKKIRKYWDGKKSDYRPEEKEELMSAIRKWCELDK